MKTLIAALAVTLGVLSVSLPASAGPFGQPDYNNVFERLGKN